MEPSHFFGSMAFSSEIIFTIIAVLFCLAIYYKTKESYALTKYEGIRYFRDAFLFLGLSYLIRFLFGISLLSGIAFEFMLPREMLTLLFIIPLGYFSTAAIFYLLFSTVWKSFDNKKMLIFGHTAAIILPIIAFITRSHFMLLYLQAVLLILAVILSFLVRKGIKKVTQTKVLYLLVLALWLISLLVLNQGRPFPLGLEIFFQAISIGVFIAIYHKVSKWAK